MTNKLQAEFGNIDIYLFDQLLKGRFDHCRRLLDAGCGGGRNIYYFLKKGYEVFGVDQEENAIRAVKELSLQLAPQNPTDNFVVAKIEDRPFADTFFDLVISSAVLHFACDKAHFENMLHAMWRKLKPGGYFFARLASDIGIESLVKSVGNDRYQLLDGSVRYLVNHVMLEEYTRQLGGELFEPIKTTNVSNLCCMTTWCIRKL